MDRSASADPPRTADLGRWLERLSALHAGVAVVAAAWGFGGNIYWIRLPLSAWASLGFVLTLLGVWRRLRQRPRAWWPLVWLAPLFGLTALVLLGASNPNYAVAPFFEGLVYRPRRPDIPWLPSSARPDLALRELWLLAGLYATGFNLALNVRRRRVLRALLLALALNAVALAIFGTVQKLVGAPGLYFGLQPSPNPAFFASFIYHNHWGPFALLMMAGCLGLIDHFGTRGRRRDFWHSPASGLLCGVLLLAASIPLSTSRSSTLLLLALITLGAGHVVRRIRAARQRAGRSARGPLLLFLAGLLLALGAVTWLGAPVIRARLQTTADQLAARNQKGGLGGREILYRNTWRMALDRPWTGWGLESYETVFVRYNTEGSPRDRLTIRYDQAHSDWLQALAETGFIGTTLLVLLAAVPLWTSRRQLLAGGDVLAQALLVTCALLTLYAWVEFPFANPAVALSFWVMFFTAVRHATLSDR